MKQATAKIWKREILHDALQVLSCVLVWSFFCAFVGIVGCGKLKLKEDHYKCDPDGGTSACPAGWTCHPSSTSDGGVNRCFPCPEGWVYIPAGEFEMGCNENDPCWRNELDESPMHTVYLSAYCIQKTQVSVAQYRKCKDSWGCTGTPRVTGANPLCNWTWDIGERENHPINCIAWDAARNYCQWLGGDLPTEAQWEKAARGTDQRTYPWGNTAPEPDCDRCNWNNCFAQEHPGTWPVDHMIENPAGDSPYGLKDMCGNVSDWTLDCYDENFYGTCGDNCVDPVNPIEGCFMHQVHRGGSFGSIYEDRVRVVFRAFSHWQNRESHLIGLRCVRPPIDY